MPSCHMIGMGLLFLVIALYLIKVFRKTTSIAYVLTYNMKLFLVFIALITFLENQESNALCLKFILAAKI